jgi:hypothetical protein
MARQASCSGPDSQRGSPVLVLVLAIASGLAVIVPSILPRNTSSVK